MTADGHRRDPIPARAGIGLRGEHYREIDLRRPQIGWLEVHTENYLGDGGLPHHYLLRLRESYPLSMHGVGLSLGSTDPLDMEHLARVAELLCCYQPDLVSEHLSWSSVNGIHANDLLPYPYTAESLNHFADRVEQVQDFLGRQVLIENPSTYLEYEDGDYAEVDFLDALCRRSGCALLLDVNNVYISCRNHRRDPHEFIDRIDGRLCAEIHLAGHTVNRFEDGELLIDTHSRRVAADVWQLFDHAIDRIGARPTLIEWDTDLPELNVLLDEARLADSRLEAIDARAA